MIDTPVSIILIIIKDIAVGRVIVINGTNEFLIITIIKCPAIRFAFSRSISVRGRIINLINSIITNATIRILGLDLGTKWIKEFSILNFIILIIIEINKITEIDKVNAGIVFNVNT